MYAGPPPLVQRRIAALLLMVIAGGIALLGRLAFLQLWQHGVITEMAAAQRYRAEPVAPERGTIFDRHLTPLAVSLYSDAVYAVPQQVADAASTARTLAAELDLSAQELLPRLQAERSTVWLATKLTPRQAERIKELALPGVHLSRRVQRFYPNGGLAAHLLGFAGIDNQGLEGLEFQYERVLAGIPGRRESERDVRGRRIPMTPEDVIPPIPGHHLVLTIDVALQYAAEQELLKGIANAAADWGLLIALRPETGEILALAVAPSFDPNDVTLAARAYRNLAVGAAFEPGSTFKIFPAAAALEEGLLRPQSLVNGPEQLVVGGHTLRCWRPGGLGRQTFAMALATSCNTAFAQLGANVLQGPLFHRYVTAFGFGETLGVDLPGEIPGLVPRPGRVAGDAVRWANVSFGQGIAVTPLQLVSAVAAVANGGQLMRPYVVREVLAAGGRVVQRTGPTAIRRVVSPETAAELRAALALVVERGTGTAAAIPGYSTAGKTGTAEVPEGGGYGDKRLASFVGFAPLDDPELVTLVMLFDVRNEPRSGGQWAAPVFSAFMRRALQYLDVPPARLAAAPAGPAVVRVPAEAAPSPVSRPGSAGGPSAGEVAVPDVRGSSMRDAVEKLARAGLRAEISGSGVAIRQSPAPGQKVPAGAAVTVTFAKP